MVVYHMFRKFRMGCLRNIYYTTHDFWFFIKVVYSMSRECRMGFLRNIMYTSDDFRKFLPGRIRYTRVRPLFVFLCFDRSASTSPGRFETMYVCGRFSDLFGARKPFSGPGAVEKERETKDRS